MSYLEFERFCTKLLKDVDATKLVIKTQQSDVFYYDVACKKLTISPRSDKKLRSNCFVAIDSVGLCPFQIQIALPSTVKLMLPFNLILSDDPNWREKFLRIINLVNKHTYLIVDTNILIRRYITGYFLRSFGREFFEQVKIMIPRLALLELEHIYNTSKEQSVKRRISIRAMVETTILTEMGASFLPELRLEMLKSFTSVAGSKITDAWIRREIRNFISNQRKQGSNLVFFLTSDFVNALCATLEGMATMLFTPIRGRELSITSLSDLCKLVINTSEVFGHIKIEFYSSRKDSPIKEILIDGIWEGKSILEWKDLYVLVNY